MKTKFAYPLIISLATVTAAISLSACNDNSSSTPKQTPNVAGNPGSANPGGGGQSGSDSGTGGAAR